MTLREDAEREDCNFLSKKVMGGKKNRLQFFFFFGRRKISRRKKFLQDSRPSPPPENNFQALISPTSARVSFILFYILGVGTPSNVAPRNGGYAAN